MRLRQRGVRRLVSAIRDLPMPGSPEISTICPSPAFASSQSRINSPTSSSRPIRGVVAVRSASKRLSTVLVRSAAHARTGSAMPLTSLAPRSSKLEEVAEKPSGALGDDHCVWLGDPLQACREVRCLADDAALLRLPRSDQVADHDQPCRNANTGLKRTGCLQCTNRGDQLQALPAPRALRHPRAPGIAEVAPSRRRPCTSPQNRRSGGRSRRRTSDRRR